MNKYLLYGIGIILLLQLGIVAAVSDGACVPSTNLQNLTIPKACTNDATLQIKINTSFTAQGTPVMNYYCYNGTSWYWFAYSGTDCSGGGTNQLFEESIFYNSLTNNKTVTTSDTSLSTVLADGKYYYGLTIYDQAGNSKYYDPNITIDTTPPIINFSNGTPLNGSYLFSNSIFVNASVVEENFDNMNIFLYNDAGELVSSKSFTTENFTTEDDLADGVIDGLADGVIGNWNFDSSYSDSLGAHNAINNGGAFFIPGKFGDAINFTGVAGSSLEIPYFNLTNYNTICAWHLTTNHAITLAQGVSSYMRHHLDAGPTNAFAYSALPYSPYDNNPYVYSYPSGITPSDGNWHFFCWVNNNDWAYRTKLYIDGTYIGQASARVTFPWLTSNYWLGKYQEGSIVKYYAYSIDELTIWNRILNQTEIITLYNNGNGISFPYEPPYDPYGNAVYNFENNFSDLSDGTYYINATAYDLAGNSNSTETRTITLDYYANNVSISAYEKITNYTVPFNTYLTNSTGSIVYNFSSTNRTLTINNVVGNTTYTVILNTTYGLGGYNTCTYNWTATDNYVFPECVFYNHRLNITAYNSYTGQAINIFNTTLTENTTNYVESQNTTNRTINYNILQGLNYSITLNPDAHLTSNTTYAAATPTGTLNLSVNQSIITLNFIHAFTQQLINNANITLNDTNYIGKIFNTSNGIIVFNPNTGTHNLKITSPRYVVRTHNLTVTDQDIRTINITLYPILNLSIYDEKLSGITPTYFNFSRPTQIKHTVYCSSNTTETKIISNTTPSGPYLLNTTCKMIKLRFDLAYSGIDGTTEYHRIIMPSPTINDFDFKVFIPDLSLPTSILQTFLEPNDIAGRYTLEKGTVLRVTKVMPTGTEVMIEDFMDAEGKITAYLIQGDSYILTVLAEGVPAKVVGIYNADSAGTKTLRLYNVGLIDPTLIGSTPTHTSLTDVRFYNLTENQSLLTMSYKDEGEFTNQLIMTIYNGSCNYKKNILMQSILERPDLILANFSAETSYNIFGSRYQNGSSNQMFCSVWNVTYSDGLTAYREETMIYDSWIPRPGIFTDPWTFPWIVMLILITIALGLNARTVSLGSLLIMVLAGIMFAWNWVQAGTPGVKTFVVFGLALLIAIGLAFKRNVI